jgi:hypothetical protein
MFAYKTRNFISPAMRVIYEKVAKDNNLSFEDIEYTFSTFIKWQKSSMKVAEYSKYTWGDVFRFEMHNISGLCQLDRDFYYDHRVAVRQIRKVRAQRNKRFLANAFLVCYGFGDERLLIYLNNGENIDKANNILNSFHPVFYIALKQILLRFEKVKAIRDDYRYTHLRYYFSEYGHYIINNALDSRKRPREESWYTTYISNRDEREIQVIYNCLEFIKNLLEIEDSENLTDEQHDFLHTKMLRFSKHEPIKFEKLKNYFINQLELLNEVYLITNDEIN